MISQIVIGTRGSELARAQARMVEKALHEKWPDITSETKIIRTSGDESRSRAGNLRHGRKGLFTAEIEKALLARDVDLAVHSAKDLPSKLTRGTEIAAVLPRALMDDVLVSKRAGGLAALEKKATIATGSVRRKHQLAWKHPGPAIVNLVNEHETLLCFRAEREFLRLLQGDCNSPVGVLATIKKGIMKMRAQVFQDGSGAPRASKVEGSSDECERLAAQLLRQIDGG